MMRTIRLGVTIYCPKGAVLRTIEVRHNGVNDPHCEAACNEDE